MQYRQLYQHCRHHARQNTRQNTTMLDIICNIYRQCARHKSHVGISTSLVVTGVECLNSPYGESSLISTNSEKAWDCLRLCSNLHKVMNVINPLTLTALYFSVKG